MTIAEMEEERTQVKAAIQNILEAGQEFQTRDGRVKFANLDKLYSRLSQLDNAIAAANGESGANTVYYKFGGFN